MLYIKKDVNKILSFDNNKKNDNYNKSNVIFSWKENVY